MRKLMETEPDMVDCILIVIILLTTIFIFVKNLSSKINNESALEAVDTLDRLEVIMK